jgi:hypothetical protein
MFKQVIRYRKAGYGVFFLGDNETLLRSLDCAGARQRVLYFMDETLS